MTTLKKIRNGVTAALFVSVLSACGGGGSSSSTGETAPAAQTVFNGTQNLMLTAPGGINESDVAPFQLTVNGDSVTISADGQAIGTGALSGNSYTVSASDTISDDGVTCTLSITYVGQITGSTTSGNITGSGACSASATSIPISVSGDFNGS